MTPSAIGSAWAAIYDVTGKKTATPPAKPQVRCAEEPSPESGPGTRQTLHRANVPCRQRRRPLWCHALHAMRMMRFIERRTGRGSKATTRTRWILLARQPAASRHVKQMLYWRTRRDSVRGYTAGLEHVDCSGQLRRARLLPAQSRGALSRTYHLAPETGAGFV